MCIWNREYLTECPFAAGHIFVCVGTLRTSHHRQFHGNAACSRKWMWYRVQLYWFCSIIEPHMYMHTGRVAFADEARQWIELLLTCTHTRLPHTPTTTMCSTRKCVVNVGNGQKDQGNDDDDVWSRIHQPNDWMQGSQCDCAQVGVFCSFYFILVNLNDVHKKMSPITCLKSILLIRQF